MNTLINSVMRYGEEIHTLHFSQKLESVQNEILRIICGQKRENHPKNDVLRAFSTASRRNTGRNTYVVVVAVGCIQAVDLRCGSVFVAI